MSASKEETDRLREPIGWREVFDQALIGMALVSPADRIQQINPALCRMLGYPHEGLLPRYVKEIIQPEDLALQDSLARSSREVNQPPSQQAARLSRKDGRTLHVLVSRRTLREQPNQDRCWLLQVIDVNEEQQRREIAEAQDRVLEMVAENQPLSAVLQEIVQRAETLNPNVRASILLLDPDGQTLHCGAAPSMPDAFNAAIEGMQIGVGAGSCGTAAATGERVVVMDVRHHPYWESYRELARLGDVGACWSEPILDGQGKVLGTFAMYYRETRAPEVLDLAFIEATAHLAGLAIAQRRTCDACLRTIMDHAPEAVLLYDVAMDCFVDASERALKLFGLEASELKKLGVAEVSPRLQPDGQPSTRAAATMIAKACQGGTPSFEWLHRHSSGKEFLAEIRLVRLPSVTGTILRASIVDISERKAAEDALKASEENLRITLDSIGDAVITTDEQGLITRMNPVAERLTGWSDQEARQRPLKEIFHVINAGTREIVEDPVLKILRGKRVVGFANDTLLVARDGSERQIADSGAPIRDGDGEIFGAVLVFRDVTRKTQIEEQLRHVQKMEAIGQLAAGVAHDFNNLLTGILGNAEMLHRSASRGSPEEECTREIIEASSRAADLTRQLLGFSRKSPARITHVNTHKVLKEVLLMLSRSIDKRIEIVRDFQAGRATILGDVSLLQNALLNLGVNARDAMPDGGQLIVRTRNVSLDETPLVWHGRPMQPGPCIEITVTDTGVGMGPEIQQRIFEPFFTTKPGSRGTGLGLAGVYGCVEAHRGAIQVESTLGAGTTFRVLLPLSENGAAGPSRAASVPQKGEGRILLVDDETIVRNFAARALRRLGYTVTACADGLEALETFSRSPAGFDLVILDMVMPKIGGLETFRRMKKIRPDLPVLVASGFSGEDSMAAMQSEGAAGFIHKPFHLSELSEEVARLCGSHRRDNLPPKG